MVPVARLAKDKFASREKIRKWKTGINEVWTNSGCSSAICKLKVYLGLLHVSPVLSIYS
jgi:hypothetical protein